MTTGRGTPPASRDQKLSTFWQWAAIEALRLAGLRAEELVELTHLSVRNYMRPNGEVIALLVISPSKSDRERVIPMSAELFHVVPQIIRRHILEEVTSLVPAVVDRGGQDRHERLSVASTLGDAFLVAPARLWNRRRSVSRTGQGATQRAQRPCSAEAQVWMSK
jgi:hypothetical protein